MQKEIILSVLKHIFESKHELSQKVFQSAALPQNFEKYTLTISSMDFADLIIELESALNIEISDSILLPLQTIEGLVERIIMYAE